MKKFPVIHNFDQGGDEWKQVKLGRFSSSSAGTLMARSDGISYGKYIKRVALERVTREAAESFRGGPWIPRGLEMEPRARKAYEKVTRRTVTQIGAFTQGEYLVASPDGLVGTNGLIEIKCPKRENYQKYIDGIKVPRNYLMQMHFQMLVSRRKYVDFVVYHPDEDLFIKRITPAKNIMQDMRKRLNVAIAELIEEVKRLESLYPDKEKLLSVPF